MLDKENIRKYLLVHKVTESISELNEYKKELLKHYKLSDSDSEKIIEKYLEIDRKYIEVTIKLYQKKEVDWCKEHEEIECLKKETIDLCNKVKERSEKWK